MGPAKSISPATEQDGQRYANQTMEAAHSMEMTKEADLRISQLLSQDLHLLKLASKESHSLQERNPPKPDPVPTGSIDPFVYDRKFSFASGLPTDTGLSDGADLGSLEAGDVAEEANEETMKIREESSSGVKPDNQRESNPF